MAAEMRRPTGAPLLIGILLAAATVAFVWGAIAERSSHHDVHSQTPAVTTPTGGESTGGESAQQHAAESGSATTPSVAETGHETEYHPLGVNLESTPLVAAAAVISLLLALVVGLRPRRGVLGAVVVVAGAFTVVEVVEVAHQASQHRPGLVALAAVAGLFHAAVAILAAGQLVTPRRIAAV